MEDDIAHGVARPGQHARIVQNTADSLRLRRRGLRSVCHLENLLLLGIRTKIIPEFVVQIPVHTFKF